MCSPNIIENVRNRISRRNLLKSFGAAGVLASTGQVTAAKPKSKNKTHKPVTFSRVVDTKSYSSSGFSGVVYSGGGKDFGTKTFSPPAIVEVERIMKYEEVKINLNKISYWEHVGTHMDAPRHFSEGSTVDQIPAVDLVLPLAVIDIKAKSTRTPWPC